MGTLMVGTKPPCKIYIDGKNTGLMSPQRSISLKPGKHKVTLINKKFKIKKTYNVERQSWWQDPPDPRLVQTRSK